MSDPTNASRAKHGGAAVRRATPDFGQNDLATDVADALTNIAHYCDSVGVDFERVVARAVDNHLFEVDVA